MSERGFRQLAVAFGNNVCPSVMRAVKDSTVSEKSKSGSENSTDEFVASSSAGEVFLSENTETSCNLIDGICSAISNTWKQVADAFSPFTSLIEDVGKPEKNKKITAGEVNNLFENIERQISQDHNVSSEVKEAVHRIAVITDREELRNVDITELLSRWGEQEHSSVLLELARRIRNGESVPLNNAELRRTLLEGLESLGGALEHLEGQSESEGRNECMRHLRRGGHCLLDSYQRIHERGSDDNLTVEDRRFIYNRLSDMQHHVDSVLSDESLSCHLGHYVDKLRNYFIETESFIEKFFRELEELEEKQEKERQCQERCDQEEKVRELHAMHECARVKKEEAIARAKRAEFEACLVMMAVKAKILRQILLREHSMCSAVEEYRRHMSQAAFHHNEASRQASSEVAYYLEEVETESSMPSPEVCEHEQFGFMNFDTCH